ncbi:MAG TPA: energy transducer TonB [Candidatus Binatia bacterium]|nr:energy transducer TonB [Candidatus Binatia bacterium]
MFEDSLVESGGRLARHNPWATALSFTAQLLICGTLVLVSLIYTEALPSKNLMSLLQAPAPPQPAPMARASTPVAGSAGRLAPSVLLVPREIPKAVVIGRDETANGAPPPEAWEVRNAVPGGMANPQITELLRSTPAVVPKVALQKVRVSSGVAEGWLILQVEPGYPALARQARIQGTVVLQAVIGRDGTVQDLHVVSGHPLLIAAAIDAVKQWRYKPYRLNGAPVEVDTQINVNFTLSRE